MSLIVPTIEDLVCGDHRYRSMLKVLDFGKLTRSLLMSALADNLKRLIKIVLVPIPLIEV